MLRLYRNITPNLSGTHYYFKDFNRYTQAIQEHLQGQIDPSRYDINKGFIRVKLGKIVTKFSYKEVTYIINTDDNICYHVTSQIIQSDYVYYGVNIDLWGSYIASANLKNINVRKCNRQISNNGIYDDIANTRDYEFISLDSTSYATLDNFVVIFIIQYNVGDDLSFQCVYGSKINDFFIEGQFDDQVTSMGILLEIAKDTGAKKVKLPSGEQRNASVIGAYILPTSAVDILDNIPFVSNLTLCREDGSEISKPSALKPISAKVKSFTYSPNIEYIQNDIYVGGVNNGLKITRRVNNGNINRIKVSYGVSQTAIKVVVTDGVNQKDITDSFSISTLKGDTQDNSAKITASALRIISGVLSTGIGIAKASPLSIVKGITGTAYGIEGAIEGAKPPMSSFSISGGGDAFLSYFYDNIVRTFSTALLSTPLKINYAPSVINESIRARKLGANFNEYVNSISEIFNHSFLGSGSDSDDTFVVASLDANDIPTSAVELIEGRFASGVYLQIL